MSNALVNIQEQLKKELEELNERVPLPTGVRISTRGRMFTFPDNTTSPGPIQAVILDWRYFNVYYEGLFDAQNVQPPSCWAISASAADLAPSSTVPKPRAESCAECQFNQFGSGPGGRGKACKNRIRVAIARPDAGVNDTPYILEVSPTGLKYFNGYVHSLGAQFNKLPIQVVTEISFQENVTYPALKFKEVRPLDEETLVTMLKLRDAAQPYLDADPATASS